MSSSIPIAESAPAPEGGCEVALDNEVKPWCKNWENDTLVKHEVILWERIWVMLLAMPIANWLLLELIVLAIRWVVKGFVKESP